jgi:hypothetical protein
MGIWLCALACLSFVIKHILLQNFVSAPTQALLVFFILFVQVTWLLHNFGGGVKRGCGPKQGQKKMLLPDLSGNEVKNYLLLYASFITSKLVHE